MRRATAIAGASSANLGPGFDVMAVALAGRGLGHDRVTAEPARRWEIAVEGPAAVGVPTRVDANAAGLAARAVAPQPVRLTIWKGLAAGSGLGSSAASAAAAALAVARLFGLRPTDSELVDAAAEGERASAGVPHRDNVAAAILGGLAIVADTPRSWPVPPHIAFCLAIPELALTTRRMRRVVPRAWPRAIHTAELAQAATVALMLTRGRVEALADVLPDSVVERRRAALIPGYRGVARAAARAGAPAVTLSGSGATVLAIVDSRHVDADRVAAEMAKAFARAGVTARGVVAHAGEGAR